MIIMKYVSGPFNDVREGIQRIRITDGCPWQCAWCHAPTDFRRYAIPPIKMERVQILDMNLLSHPEHMSIIQELPNGPRYELVCGVDYRFLNESNARLLKSKKFTHMRFAWDGPFSLQKVMNKTRRILQKTGFRNLSCFMICNHESVMFQENLLKLDLLKVWGVKACDCYYDGQVSPRFKEIAWTLKQMRTFRRKCRKHNQMVSFGIDPEYRARFYPAPRLNFTILDFIDDARKSRETSGNDDSILP